MPQKKVPPNKDLCTETEFHEAVGRAIIHFQNLETATSTLFGALLGARNEVGARAAFYTLQNNATRIQLMDVAARWLVFVRGGKKLRKRWEDVRDRLREASALRNRVAHSDLNTTRYPTGTEYSLVNPFMNWSRLEPGFSALFPNCSNRPHESQRRSLSPVLDPMRSRTPADICRMRPSPC